MGRAHAPSRTSIQSASRARQACASLLDDAVVAVDLERLASEQEADGRWSVDFESYSPAAALEWRGYATVRALSVLRRNRGQEAGVRLGTDDRRLEGRPTDS